MFNFQLFDDTGSTKRRFTGGREREQICRQVKVLSSQQRISPEGSQTDSQPKLEGQIYTQLSREMRCWLESTLTCLQICSLSRPPVNRRLVDPVSANN